ncbi:hypothetical protein B0T12DRAFT_493038 [Alternaria alternata]|nr:hypothetical protein B0T12DRAFT_493038 [Alternaria alternata]RYN89673.1 hypothetical protein AA0120_g6194 [Alternaria tenuissima]
MLNTLPSISNATTANTNSSGAPSPIDSISERVYAPLPAILPKTPKPRPRQPFYRGKDEVKRAVTNPNLRAILADKSYPKERRKAAGELPVLKMGISKEYK